MEITPAMRQAVDIAHTLFCTEDHGPKGNCDYYVMLQVAGHEEDEYYQEWCLFTKSLMHDCEIENPEDFLTAYKSIAAVLEAFGELGSSAQKLFTLLTARQASSVELSQNDVGLLPEKHSESSPSLLEQFQDAQLLDD